MKINHLLFLHFFIFFDIALSPKYIAKYISTDKIDKIIIHATIGTSIILFLLFLIVNSYCLIFIKCYKETTIVA